MSGGVTVLLFLLAACTTLYAQPSGGRGLAVYEFRCDFRTPIAAGRVDGLIATEAGRRRVAIYWIEPALFREAASFLRYCDLIFDREAAQYWIQGMSHPGTFHLSAGEKDPLLPAQRSAESVLRSALAIVSQMHRPSDATVPSLEVGAFFEESRGQAEYRHEVLPYDARPPLAVTGSTPSARLLNALPFGREYSKDTRADGSTVWRVEKASGGPPVATVTIQRVHELGLGDSREAFNEQTLGQWTLIPDAYRVYWSLDCALVEVNASAQPRAAAGELYARLDSYLARKKAPCAVARALDRLLLKAALLTADSNCVWQAAQAVVTRLCQDDNVPRYQCLVDAASMSAQIQKEYPERLEERLRPLVARVVWHVGQEARADLDRLIADITNNGLFTYGELLLDEMRQQGLVEAREADTRIAKLQASRLAKGTATPDSSEVPPSVARHLAQLDSPPAQGTVDVNDLRHILSEGLAKRFTAERSEAKRQMVESAIRSLRLIVGEGPFSGDSEKLIASIDRFSHCCLEVDRSAGSFGTVLATFLALSFCDTSTPEDHQRLFSQLQHCTRDLQARVNGMLGARGLGCACHPRQRGASIPGIRASLPTVYRRSAVGALQIRLDT